MQKPKMNGEDMAEIARKVANGMYKSSIEEISHLSKISYASFSYLKILHFDANPIKIGYLVTDL